VVNTLWDELAAWTEASPHALAVADDHAEYTTTDLLDYSERLARGLSALGVGPGDRVLLRAVGNAETVAVAVAAARLDAVVCPHNALLGTGEVTALAGVVRPAATVDAEDVSPVLAAAARQHLGPVTDIDPVALALLGFTGGTTGTPKAVMHSWATTRYAVESAARIAGLQPGEPTLSTLSIGSAPGFTFGVHLALRLQGALVLRRHFRAAPHLRAAQAYSCRWTVAVPTQVQMLTEAAGDPDVGVQPLRAMRTIAVGGAPMHAEALRAWEHALGAPMVRMFGMSECLGHSSTRLTDTPEDRLRYDGLPFEGTDVEAFGPDGSRLSRGSRGQAGVRGPSLFLGYYGQPEATTERFTPDGYFLTGDTIMRSPDGYIEVVGRESDLIIRGGTNIDPTEIEDLLLRHPDVRDVSVVGVPDARLGEAICAFVVLRSPGRRFDVDTARQHFDALETARYKRPDIVVVLDELPMTAMGKVKKSHLRALAAAGSEVRA
jgi:acyl-CoA synthetase